MITIDDIKAAAERIKGGVYYSPCPPSAPLSEVTGCEVYCKLDYLQRTGSFKERGARNAMLQLSDAQKERGVIAASAGNHALGLAYHGSTLGIPVTVVMPVFAPLTKVSNCQRLGAKIVQHGEDFQDAVAHARGIAEREKLTYVHGFDDLGVIAGQGTMGLEMLDQVPDLEAVIVPIGGAGLIAGIALAIKSQRPDVQIIGVEPRRAASYTAALKAGKPVEFDVQATLADGLAVNTVGTNAFAIARDLVDDVVIVDEDDVSLAVLRLAELEKAVVEGAGASPLAACIAGLVPSVKGKKVVLPLCGGNLDIPILGRIIEAGLVVDGRLCRFTARISDRPGGLARLARIIADCGASVRQIDHERAFSGGDVLEVNVDCMVETRSRKHMRQLRQSLRDANVPVTFHYATENDGD